MTIRSRDQSNTKLLAHLNDILVKLMLFGDVIPLEFSVPTVAEDFDEASGGLPHCFPNGFWSLFAVLPIVAGVWSA